MTTYTGEIGCGKKFLFERFNDIKNNNKYKIECHTINFNDI